MGVLRSVSWVSVVCAVWCACGVAPTDEGAICGSACASAPTPESEPVGAFVAENQMIRAAFGHALVTEEPAEPFDAGEFTADDAGTTAAGPLQGLGEWDAGAPFGFDDAGTGWDAGAAHEADDAGVTTDAGSLDDAGARGDGGAAASNAWSPPGDGGGAAPNDAGSSFDAGTPGPGLRVSAHTSLGLPDDSSAGRVDRWLLVKPQYVVSYDTLRKTPRWVSWRLDSTWFGPATRATSFRRDPQLPTSAAQATNTDFTNSGFDRGHLCPSADRTSTDADNDATFVFTNVVPQTHQSNAGPWSDLEDEARRLVGLGKTVAITAGPVFGLTPTAIGSGVPVPLSTFKVLVVFDGPPGASAVSAATRVIAVNVPNTTSVSGDWRQFRVTTRALEQQTGLDFLSDVSRPIQDLVETRLDLQ